MFARAGVSERSLVPPSPKQLVDTRVRVPLAFEPNFGQAAAEVRWISRTPDRTFLLTGNEAVMLLKAGNETAHHQNESDRRPDPIQPQRESTSSTARAITSSATSQTNGAPPFPTMVAFATRMSIPVSMSCIYSTDRRLEYDFVLAPGADPAGSSLRMKGRIAYVWRPTAISYLK